MANNLFNKFSPEAQQIFRANGIHEQRRVDYHNFDELLVNNGYLVLDIVKDFFNMCGFYRIKYPYDTATEVYSELTVDPTGYIDPDDREDLYKAFGLNLCPLGYSEYGAQFAIDEFGKVYWFEDGHLDLLGNDLVSGIEEEFKGKNRQRKPTCSCRIYFVPPPYRM